MKKTKMLLRMYWNYDACLVCVWFDMVDGCCGSMRFMGYPKKAVVSKLRASGISVGRVFEKSSKDVMIYA